MTETSLKISRILENIKIFHFPLQMQIKMKMKIHQRKQKKKIIIFLLIFKCFIYSLDIIPSETNSKLESSQKLYYFFLSTSNFPSIQQIFHCICASFERKTTKNCFLKFTLLYIYVISDASPYNLGHDNTQLWSYFRKKHIIISFLLQKRRERKFEVWGELCW